MKKLATLFFSLCIFFDVTATTFTVTSFADSGPGSLREAITMANANGTATVDYIYFNIPQTVFTQRIINLVTELPALSSNIILDGTTQPGAAYGTTDAKVCLKKNDYAPTFSMLKVKDAQHVEIYGMALYYGYWQGLFGPPYRSTTLYCINLINSSNIQIGDVGKGNVMTGAVDCIFSDGATCSDISIKSNYMGESAYYSDPNNDIDPVILMSQCCITLADVKNISIGGITPAEGNIFGSKTRGISIDSRNTTGNGSIIIQNNLFGKKYDKVTSISVYDFWDNYINIGRSRNNPVNWTLTTPTDYKVILLDNDIGSHAAVSNITDSVIVKRNRFTEDQRDNNHPFKLVLSSCIAGGIVGGTTMADSNVFRNNSVGYNSLAVYYSGPITVLKNTFECNSLYGSTTIFYNYFNQIPFAQVDTTAPAFVKGRATPGAKVDLYYDDPCTACEGRIYIASVTADNSGQWTYNGATNGTVIVTATTSLGYTGPFSTPVFNSQNKIVKQPTCGKNNGSVTNITSEGAETYFWLNVITKDTVSHSIDLLNVGPGSYMLYGVHGGTCINTMGNQITLDDISPKILLPGFITQPSCGLFNGAISGLNVTNIAYSTYKWIDNTGQTIGTNLNINNLGPGTYRFVLIDTTARGGCSDTATFTLVNQSGPSLNMANKIIKEASCGNNNGSITGITTVNVTGTTFILWLDSLNNPVGNTLDLLNIKAGKYRMKFKDQTNCDTIVTPFYIVPDVGSITIDTSGKLITASKCAANTGSIEKLTVTNGQNFSWVNVANNSIVGTAINVYGLAPANYQLTVTNALGCSKQSPVITVPQTTFVPIVVTAFTLQHALCGLNNGVIKIDNLSNNAALFTFRWVDSISGQAMGTGMVLSNVGGGTYMLIAKDSNGCEKKIFSALIKNLPPPSFDYTKVKKENDNCNLSQGSIAGIVVNGLTGPTAYTWYDQNNIVKGNSLALSNVGAGNYVLKITDAGVCNVQSAPFIITNIDNALPAPVYDNLVIPRYTTADLNVKNPSAGQYFLMKSAAPGSPILLQNNTGNFNLPSVTADTVYYVRHIDGTCSSAIVPVNIKVVDRSYFAIPNAFTPNGDGLNDRIAAKVIGYIELNYFKIYNKWGELVFETRQLNEGWNGVYKGVMQNTGTYIWIAQGKDITGNIISDKGSFTLIR